MIQRKLFWCCAALAVAAAGAGYLAAGHAHRNPESCLGRAVIAVYQSVSNRNPLHALGEAAGGHTSQVAQVMTGGPCDEPGRVSCAALEFQVTDGRPTSARLPEGACPVIDLGQCRLPGRIIINEEEEPRRTAAVTPPEMFHLTGAAVELLPLPTLVGDETVGEPPLYRFEGDAIRIMPRAADDARALMPRAADDAPGQGGDIPELWKQYLRKAVEAESSQEEQSEPRKPGQPPDLRENPDHHLDYPGCPNLGDPHRNTCPYTGRSAAPTPKQEEKPRKSESAEPQAQREPPTWFGIRKSQRRFPQPEADTTEFRPSDANGYKLGGIPF